MKNVIIMGAAGRDFHDFLTYFKDNKHYKVVGFTASQIPGIAKRKFPAALAGKRYPKGIPIFPAKQLPKLIKKLKVDEVVLSYSDLPHEHVMHKASKALAAGANFRLLSYKKTALKSKKKIISVCAVRTGCGKSQVSRKIVHILKHAGLKVVQVRHPMPYGDLAKQAVQRFGSLRDLDKANCTIEEREEYESPIRQGITVYAGVDYKAILRKAEKEADVIIWDGGNNDVPFFKSDLHIVVVDPLRAGHEMTYHPGEENFRLADVIVINKIDSAKPDQIKQIEETIKNVRKGNLPIVIKAESTILVNKPEVARGKKVLVVEDGPTLTHGGMAFGAGEVAARKLKCKVINPRPYAVGSIKQIFKKFKTLGNVVPAMGYSHEQTRELQRTINNAPVDVVIDGSPSDLAHLLKVNKPIVNVEYEIREKGKINLKKILRKFL
ncbi:MAG: cyclic 2,3-diphosphoglycerate synthase [Candidatus Nanoarchaeia archaeon]